jgi:hypothetical protein
MLKATVLAALMLAGTSSPALAQNMNAEAFHKRASALQRKGPMAIFSRGEIKTLMGEVQNSAARAREGRLAAVRAGGKPLYCPPDKGNLDANDFMKRLSTIPAAERARMDMTEATVRVLATKWPCR